MSGFRVRPDASRWSACLHNLRDRAGQGQQGAVPQLVEGREEAVGEHCQGHVLQQRVGGPRVLPICIPHAAQGEPTSPMRPR